jgi:hypothetical protein
MGWLFTEAKTLIDYVARAVELAAAVIIAVAALEATIRALALFVRRGAPPEAKNALRLSFARGSPLRSNLNSPPTFCEPRSRRPGTTLNS